MANTTFRTLAIQFNAFALNRSMYVPGTIKDASNVIIEVGTGYYVENVSCVPANYAIAQ